MDDETSMDHQTTPVHVVRRHVSPQTVILRLGTKLNLAKYPAYQVTNAIGVAAGLTASEVRDVQNLVAATSGRESATQKLAGLRLLTLNGERHDVTAYVAAEAHHARCVVHGLPKDIPDDQLLSIISIEDWQILAARRISQSEAILFTVKGATIPKEVKMGLYMAHKNATFPPSRGHRANVCPTAHEFTRCETCGQQFPAGQQPERTAHECELKCFNCEGPHGARDPRCPKKQQADKLARIAAEKRRLRSTTKGLCCASEESNNETNEEERRKLSLTATSEPIFSFTRYHTGPTTGTPAQVWQSARLRNETTSATATQAENPKLYSAPRLWLPKNPRTSNRDIRQGESVLHWVAVPTNNTPTHASTSTASYAGPQVSAPPHYFLAYKAETDTRLETIEKQPSAEAARRDTGVEILKQLAALARSLELLRNAATTRRRGTARDDAHPYKLVNTNNGNVE
ncbi:hypothetical protein HPB50_013426 [Hyalomma asiaticum]|uniref:Uncharacterized protein n=1 Tax=Hyalomma asiaticum TaxID=266040 RepID=A0ACB7RL45_HYAAI|nr:hypothetical protein HPB50_013426 [Hyalomma asiaticum]